MQKFLAAAVLTGGVAFLCNEHFIVGALLVAAGALVFNGASQGEPYSFDFSDWGNTWGGDGGSGSSGGGDGGGD